jgi:two-component sensor histidine kinase
MLGSNVTTVSPQAVVSMQAALTHLNHEQIRVAYFGDTVTSCLAFSKALRIRELARFVKNSNQSIESILATRKPWTISQKTMDYIHPITLFADLENRIHMEINFIM